VSAIRSCAPEEKKKAGPPVLLKIKGRFCDSWRRSLLIRAGEAKVVGRREAAASCGGRSLAANMDYYNIRVNVALRFASGAALRSREVSAVCMSVSILSVWDVKLKTPPSPAARTGHPEHILDARAMWNSLTVDHPVVHAPEDEIKPGHPS
jgi:hypothetical protein